MRIKRLLVAAVSIAVFGFDDCAYQEGLIYHMEFHHNSNYLWRKGKLSLSERHGAALSTLLGFVPVRKAMNLFLQPCFSWILWGDLARALIRWDSEQAPQCKPETSCNHKAACFAGYTASRETGAPDHQTNLLSKWQNLILKKGALISHFFLCTYWPSNLHWPPHRCLCTWAQSDLTDLIWWGLCFCPL